MTKFDNYFQETCDTINKKIMENYLGPRGLLSKESNGDNIHGSGASVFVWAQTNEAELFLQEEQAYSRIDETWNNANDFEKFKKTVLEWGRVVLKIYKKFSESPHGLLSKESSGEETQDKTHQMSFST